MPWAMLLFPVKHDPKNMLNRDYAQKEGIKKPPEEVANLQDVSEAVRHCIRVRERRA